MLPAGLLVESSLGLTIHYSFKSNARNEEEARAQVEALHAYAKTLPFDDVDRVVTYRKPATLPENLPRDDHRSRWCLIQSAAYCQDPRDEKRSYVVPPAVVIGFSTGPADGAEDANFGLARYPATIQVDDRRIKTGLSGWRWRGFCKTQYASRHGIENFLRGHTNIIRVLDEAKRLGILEGVDDEGGYWESRSLESLAKSVGEWNEMIAAFVGKLDDIAPPGTSSIAPIKDYDDYEHLEARGRDDESTDRKS